MKNYLVMLSAAVMLVLAGCSSPTDDAGFSDRLVVNAYLYGGQPIDSVYIQKTGRVTELYTDENAAVNNAIVIITGNSVSDTLAADPLHPGRYASKARSRLVQPGETYSLVVKAPGYPEATGTTTVPDTFSVLNASEFSPAVPYAPTRPPMRITWSPSARYADYLIAIRSVDPTTAMIPTDFHQGEDKPDRVSIGFFLRDVNACDISWLYFNYYGKTQIAVAAIDQNYHDYLKQMMAAQAASDLKEIRFNLNGAIGVFGSETVAKNLIELTITP